jgi:hypothetical protein
MRKGIRSESFNALSRFYGVLPGPTVGGGERTDLVEAGASADGELAPKLVLC